MSDDQAFHLYILLCDQTVLYTGIAIDPAERLKQHQAGAPYGAKFTRRFRDLKIVYQIKVGERSLAQSLEIKLKKLSRPQKQHIIQQQPKLGQLQALL